MASTGFSLVRLVTAVLCRLQTFFSQILGSQAPNSRSFLPLTCRLTIVTLLHLLSRMFSLPRRLPAPISPLLRLPPRHGFAQFEPRAPTHWLTSCNRVQTAPRIREFLSPPRAPHRCNMTSTTGNNKTTPIVLISTPTLHRLQRIKALIRRTPRRLPSSFHVRPRAQDWAAPGTSPVFSTLAAPPPHMRHCAHLWDSIDNSLKKETLRISYASLSKTSSAASRRQRLRREPTLPNWRTLSTANTTICSSVTPRQSPPRSTTPKLPSPRLNRTPESADLDWVSSESKRALRPPRWKPHLGRTSPSPRASGSTHGPSTQAQHPQRKWRHHQHEPPRQALPCRLDSSTLPWTPI